MKANAYRFFFFFLFLPGPNLGNSNLYVSGEGSLLQLGDSISSLPPLIATTPAAAAEEKDYELSPPGLTTYFLKKKPFFVVPPGFHPNAIFVGMQKEMEILHSIVFKSKKRHQRLMAVLVCGVTGSGKSHLVRQYVWTHLDDYPGGIFWVDAKSFQSTCKCFWDIAVGIGFVDSSKSYSEFGDSADIDDQEQQFSNTRYIDAVRNWFQSRDEWLLVFDGVSFDGDDDINQFKQFLPSNKMCSIIYTSIDKTLARKQRLFEPYCLTVSPLGELDGCRLLFKDLAIRRPSQRQVTKARELVNQYEGLPLALHAIGRRLSATAKPIEKYHRSHLTDQKLAEPFLGIMNDLFRMRHFEALNLINLLSFFGHHVPIGLITLGYPALEPWDAQILTSSRPGERPDLDTTLRTLMRYGLVERTADPYELWYPKDTNQNTQGPGYNDNDSNNNNNGNGNESSVEFKRVLVAADSSESMTDGSSQDGLSSIYHNVSSIDVIKIHSVVQTFCRDELRIMDKEVRAMGFPESANYYDSWLVVATLVFCRSFERAKGKMDLSQDVGLVRDYRELATQGSRLLSLYPKKFKKSSNKKQPSSPSSPPPSSLPLQRQAFNHLKEIVSSIEGRIEDASRRRLSQEEIRNRKSVFDRGSSTSSSLQDSTDETTVQAPSRRSTWDSHIPEDEPKTGESQEVDDRAGQHVVSFYGFNLKPFPPHNYRDPGDDVIEAGYETDVEETKGPPRSVYRSQPAFSPSLSQITFPERPTTPATIKDMAWKVVEPPKQITDYPGQSTKSRIIRPLAAGDKPVSPVVTTSSAMRSTQQWEPIGERLMARDSLAFIHNSNPPLLKVQKPMITAENNNASLQAESSNDNAARSATSSIRKPSPSGQLFPIETTGRSPSRESMRSIRATGQGIRGRGRGQSDTGAAPATHTHKMNESTAFSSSLPASRGRGRSQQSKMITRATSRSPAPLLHPASNSAPNMPLPYEKGISIPPRPAGLKSHITQLSLPIPIPGNKSLAHPSAIMPGSSPPSTANSFPSSSCSHSHSQVSEPMTREPSGQSQRMMGSSPLAESMSLQEPLMMPMERQHSKLGLGLGLGDDEVDDERKSLLPRKEKQKWNDLDTMSGDDGNGTMMIGYSGGNGEEEEEEREKVQEQWQWQGGEEEQEASNSPGRSNGNVQDKGKNNSKSKGKLGKGKSKWTSMFPFTRSR